MNEKRNQQKTLFDLDDYENKKIVEYSSMGNKKTKDSNNNRKKLDKFYSNDEAVNTIMAYVINFLNLNNIDINKQTFLEPCAGNGAFLKGLRRNNLNNKILSYDIMPESEEIIKANFLEIDPEYDTNLITIGNPPFGYKGNLAYSFINKCSEWSDIIVFILPIQFRRFNLQKFVDNNLKLIHSSENFPRYSFILDNKKHNVNCLFQVWVKKNDKRFEDYNDLRQYKSLPNKHEDFELYTHNNTKKTLRFFDKKKYNWEYAVHRQGFYDYSIKIYDEAKLKPHIQYLFIKFNNNYSRKVFDKIDFIKLSKTNTSIPGFSNTDLVAEYNSIKKMLGEI